jgi:hypothetical protein
MVSTFGRSERSGWGARRPATSLSNETTGLDGGGVPLPRAVRAPAERRLGHDFSNVRVHHDRAASRAAGSLNARAVTTGNHIVFGRGEYSPETSEGRQLLAHELAHVVQQRKLGRVRIQRKIKVKDYKKKLSCTPAGEKTPPTKWGEVARLIRTLSGSTFVVNKWGNVWPKRSACSKAAKSKTVIRCLCDMALAKQRWTIIVDDQQWPHTNSPPTRTIVINSRCAPFKTMAWGGPKGSKPIVFEQWRVLAHELCGHAHLMQKRAHPASVVAYRGGRAIGRPAHDPTVAITNLIAKEVLSRRKTSPTARRKYVPRAMFASPHHGESIIRFQFKGFKPGHSTLTASMRSKAATVAAMMNKENNLKLRAEAIGHTDRSFMWLGHRRVSWRRAINVIAAIIRAFPAAKRKSAPSRFRPPIAMGKKHCAAKARQADCRKVDVYLFSREGSRRGYRYQRFTTVKVTVWAKWWKLTRAKVRALNKRLGSIFSVIIYSTKPKDSAYRKLEATFHLWSMKLPTLKKVIREIAKTGVWTSAERKATQKVLIRMWNIRHKKRLP